MFSIIRWIKFRLTILSLLEKYIHDYKVPRNLNILWNTGSIILFLMLLMIISGIFLSFHYVNQIDRAFDSVEYIIRTVPFGWLINSIHKNGTSFIFITLYLHIFRSIYYRTYIYPKELIWITGVFLLFMITISSLTGYILPWSQMSFWGVTIIKNIILSIPFVDRFDFLKDFEFNIGSSLLTKLYPIHFLNPFIILFFIIIHIISLHNFGSTSPSTTIENKTIPLHPYYTIKDLFGISLFLTIFCFFIFFFPDFFECKNRYKSMNDSNFIYMISENITPEWYFLPFYTILKAIPNKSFGIMTLISSFLVLFILPWIDKSPTYTKKRTKNLHNLFSLLLAFNLILLGFLGSLSYHNNYIYLIMKINIIYYFIYFLFILPIIGRINKK